MKKKKSKTKKIIRIIDRIVATCFIISVILWGAEIALGVGIALVGVTGAIATVGKF